MDTIVFKNKFAKVTHLSDSKTLFIKWNDNPAAMSLEEYQVPFQETMKYQLGLSQKAENFLSDISDQQTVSPKYQKWLQQEILAKASDVGIKHIGIVLTANAFKRFYINRVIGYVTKVNLPIKTFKNVNEALSWFAGFKS